MKDIGACVTSSDSNFAPDYTAWTRPADLNPAVFEQLYIAAMNRDKSACNGAIATALKTGVSSESVADAYIPALAHRIGMEWCEDEVSFAQVTIGTARLQAMLRDLGPEWTADHIADADAPLILLLSPQKAHHTLGTVLLAGQLRRRGYSVRMVLDPSREELSATMQKLSFDAIFISASEFERLEDLRRMVNFLRTLSVKPLPIAIGGGLLRVERDIAPLVGIDIATSNIDEAVEHCGLNIPQKKSALRVSRS